MMSLIRSMVFAPAVDIIKGRATSGRSDLDRRTRNRRRNCRAHFSARNFCGSPGNPLGFRAARAGTAAAVRGGPGGFAMKCSDIMNRNLEWLTETDTVLKAATLMAEANVGFLPICDARRRVIG